MHKWLNHLSSQFNLKFFSVYAEICEKVYIYVQYNIATRQAIGCLWIIWRRIFTKKSCIENKSCKRLDNASEKTFKSNAEMKSAQRHEMATPRPPISPEDEKEFQKRRTTSDLWLPIIPNKKWRYTCYSSKCSIWRNNRNCRQSGCNWICGLTLERN